MKKRRFSIKKRIICLLFGLLTISSSFAQWQTIWENKGPSFRAIAIESQNEILVSGSKGQVLLSKNGGQTWQNLAPKSYEQTDFRGIEILKENTYLAMSSGPAEEKKAFLLKSTNGGLSWLKTFENDKKGVFYDAIAFKNKKTGYLLGDPTDGKAFFYKTTDGGKTWTKINNIPEFKTDEASYAASNSNILIQKNKVWFCTQNRIFYSKNKGKNWVVFETPFEKINMKGIYGLGLNQSKNIIAVGGDYNNKEESIQFAFGDKTGKTWDVGANAIRLQATESIAILNNQKLIAVGTGGTYMSKNQGKDWQKISEIPLHVVACKNGTCYAAGNGIIVRATERDFENK